MLSSLSSRQNTEPLDEEPARYRIDYSEPFEIELEKGYLYLSQFIGTEKTQRWVEQVHEMCRSLREHPRRYAALKRRPDLRRVLVGRYYIVYRVIELTKDEEPEGIVRILNLVHATSRRAS